MAISKHGRIMLVSREVAIANGLVEPTPEEQAEIDQRRAELEQKRSAVTTRIPGELAKLDAIDDPVCRAVLDLHRRDERYAGEWITHWTCPGCDMDGMEAEAPEWPCRTVELVAAHHGVDLTDVWLFARPVDGSLDQPAPTTSTEA